jgi:hypothetical protein
MGTRRGTAEKRSWRRWLDSVLASLRPGPRDSRSERAILELLRSHDELTGLEMVKASGGVLRRGTVYVWAKRLVDKGQIRSRRRPDGRLAFRAVSVQGEVSHPQRRRW